MIYLDYSATTPILLDVLDSYNKASKDYIGNPNSLHELGVKSKELLNSALKQMCDLLNIDLDELIITSGATESNNMIFKGLLNKYGKGKKNIIVSKLEHPSIYIICDYLKTKGYTITYVDNDENGVVSFDDLKNKINKDTFLVSICAVNSETGVRQPLKTLRQIMKKENPDVIFHSDITQALGKVNVNLHDVDLASASAHKIYGPKGVGFVYKSKKIDLEPLIHGSSKIEGIRPGTPALPLIVAFSKALRITLNNLDQKEHFVSKLNDKLVNRLSTYTKIKINKTNYSIPHILNISLMDIKSETFVHAMAKDNVYISTNTACSKGELSNAIMAIYNDKQRASTTLRISLSHITTLDEINKFLEIFDKNYIALSALKNND